MKRKLAALAAAILVVASIWLMSHQSPSPSSLPVTQADASAGANTSKSAQDPAPRASVPIKDTAASGESSGRTATPITDFRKWAETYLATPENLRRAMLPTGMERAKAHTAAIAELIRKDPEQAIANAVPMVIRQDLPAGIVGLLENRVSMKASLNVYGNVPLPGMEAAADFEPYTRSVSQEDGSHWNAFVYGKRASQRTISTASINGISVGKDMAVADSPLRQLEPGERPNPAGRDVVEVCPVSKKETVVERTESGKLPAVTDATPAFETPERIVYVCSGGHIAQVVEELSAEEEREHWASQGGYLNAGAGSGTPTAPLGTIPGSTTTGRRTFLYIRATFPDHLIDPQSDAECHDSLRQMADYISQTSYGRCYFTYAVAPLIVLPYPESWYLQYQADGSAADTLIQNQARTIAKEMGYDYLAYDLDAVRWNGSVGAYGGSASVGGRGMRLKTNAVGTFCHELGHNLGVWHANYWRTTPPSLIGPGNNLEYGNSFDLMGNSGSMGQYTAHFKNILSWLPTETYWTVNSPGTYRLHQFDSSIAEPSYRYALRIQKDAEREYWAEFRQRLSTNTGFMNGLMMTWDGWGQGNIGGSGGAPPNGSNKGAQLLDMTPGTFGNGITDTRNDSALWVGRTFSDEDAKIHITPVAKNASTVPPSMDVYVSMGDIPGNLAPSLSVSASNTTPAVNGSITLTATASDPNGDPLAYAWVFNDGTYSTNNSAVQTKSWSTAGHYQVLCTASDMKGKRTTRSILITVGTPTTFTVSGNITGPDALPLEGVYVANYAPSNNTSHSSSSTFHGTWTDSNGNYTITGITAGSYTITPTLYPNDFTPTGFTNPVVVGPSTSGKNFSSSLLPTVTISVPDPIANEGSTPGTGTIRLTRTGSTAAALSVQIFNTNNGTATRNTDYTLSPAPTASTNDGGSGTSQYDIPAGVDFVDITVTPVNDSTAEGREYAALNFANTSGGYVLAGPAVAIVEIVDDENPNLPVVKLTQLDNVASESGPDLATLKLERNGATTASLTVNLTPSGTATSGTDYTMPTSVVIPADSASTTFTLTPIDDTAQEGTETATITIATNAGYARDTLSNAQTVALHDNDLPTVSVAATDATLTEAPGNPGFFTISRTGGNPYLALTVDYALAGRAVHGADYRRLDGRAVIPAGATSTTVEIYPVDDTVAEGTQDVILQLRSATTYEIGGTGTATMSITDNDGSQLYVRLTNSGVVEPATGSVTAVTYQIIRPASGAAITVNYAMSGTATSGSDYTALSGSVAFAAGDTVKTINVAALADTALEDAESVTLTLLPGNGYTLMAGQPSSATGFIVDGDQPTLDVSAADTATALTSAGSETTASLRFIVSRDVSTTSDLVVNYTMAGTATEGVDYTGTTGSVTILAGATSAYVTIVPVNDTTAEGVESITMNLTPASGTYGLRTPSATLLLADNDAFASGSVGFAATTSSIAEDVGTHPVAVNLTGTPSGTVAVNYRVSGGTATGIGYDYTLADGVLTFPPGTTTLNIPIPIIADTLPEPSETITLQLYNAIGGNLGTSTHTVTINNRSLPEAFTDVATSLLANGATLNGHVLPNAVATDVWFQYGPTATYGSTTTLQSIGSGTTSVNVSAAITGFAPGGYHYRCVAQNSLGTTYGIDQVISSNNANLTGLVTSVGTFSPTFDAAVLTYSVTVPSGTSSVTISPTVAQANATVKVNGTTVASGTPSAAIAIGSGTTTVNVVVTAQDGVTSKTYTLNIAPAGALTPQTITFAALPATTYGNVPLDLTATASSGLPVSYSSSNPLVATVSGSTVTLVGAGSTNITATQSGNGTYEAAPPVLQSLVVNQASQSISFSALATVLDDVAPFTLNATASSGLTVSYASSNPAVATVSGNTVTVVGVGTTTITASQAGNTNYAAATSVPQPLTVGRANPLAVVTGSPYTVLIGQSLSLNGSASLASYGETLTTYEWDLNNDSVFGDATGATPATISYAALTGTWGMVPGSNSIGLRVTDSASKTSTVSATVQILVSLSWDSNGTTAGQTNGAGAWLGANQWWDGVANQTWATGASAVLGGPNTAGGAVTLAGPTSVNAITFNAFTGTYTLGTAAQTLTINGGINMTAASGIVSLISPVALGAAQSWTNNATGSLTVSAGLDTLGSLLTVDGSGSSSLTGVISGTGGIVKNGSGKLSFNNANANTYTGPTTINGGVLMMANNIASIGSGNVTLSGGVLECYWGLSLTRALGAGDGQIQLSGGASGFGENGTGQTFTINFGNNAANEAVWGSTYFNPSTLVLQTQYSQGTSSVVLANNLDLNGATRTIQVSGGVSGTATATLSGVIRSSSGTAGLIKTGTGNLILSAANTFTGNIAINAGSLQVGNNTAGTLAGGTYGGAISLSSGTSLRVFSSANQTLSGVISGSGGLTKAYAGTLTLSGANTFSGKVSITPQSTAGAGTLSVSSFNSVVGGTASSSLGAPTTVANGTIDFGSTGVQGGATLKYTGPGETTDRVLNFLFNGTGVTKTLDASGSGLLKFTSPFTGSGSTTNAVALTGTSNGEIVGGLPFTFSGLTKSGSGTWTLGGTVGNSGTTTVSAGRLTLGANHVLPNTTPVSIAAATLDAATFTDAMGALDVTAAATINLGSGGSLQFADSSTISWSGGTLAITGNFVPGSSLRFGTTASGLTATQLALITAVGFGPLTLDANGYLIVAPLVQTISFGTLPARTYGDAPFALTASASSGLAVSYESSNPAVATVSGSTVTIVGVGSTTFTASQPGDSSYAAATPVTQTLVVNQAVQTINFPALPARTFGDSTFALTATTSSGLAVSYNSSNPEVAAVSGSTLTIVGVGSTTITAMQPGNANYAAATSVPQTLTVIQAPQTISFAALPARVYGDEPFGLTATASSSLAVSYTSSNSSVATISGSTVTIVGAGSTTITAEQSGDASYAAATSVAQTLTVSQASQVIAFAALPSKTYGDTPFPLTTSASSNLAVSYSSSNPSVATISGSTVTIVGAGTTTITASQAGDTNYSAATNVEQTLTVSQASQVITFGALPTKTYGDASFSLNASSSSGLGAAYESSNPSVATVSGSTVTIVGAGTTTITASQTGDSNHAPATSIQQVLTVSQASQAISFAELSAMTYGDGPFALTATASSGLPVSYTTSNPAVATVSGSAVTIVGAGTTTITASQAGDINHSAATSVVQTLTVSRASQAITFDPLPAVTYGDASFNLTASASSGLAVNYISSNPLVATVSGSTVTLVGVGSTTITASQTGDANHNAAAAVPQTLEVLSNLDIPVIYEPFADTQTILSGNTPGSGLSGTWISGGMNVSPTGLIFGSLPVSGGMAIKPSGNASANASVALGGALNNAHLLNDGATLWFSFLYKRPAPSGTNDQAGFAIGDSSLNSTGDTMSAGSNGFGVFLGRSSRVQASYWNNGARTSSSPASSVIAADATVLVVGKIVWNGNSAAPDTLQLYLPSANLLLPATPHSTSSFILNQSTFDTISFGGKNTESPTIDEIRFGATYNSVTGQSGTGSSGVVVLTAYETWAAAYGGGDVLGSPSDDADHDGVPNLVEYALGTTPDSASSAPAVLPEVSGNRLRLNFTPQVVSGLSYTVESSMDLNEWSGTLIPAASLQTGVPFSFMDSVDISGSIAPQRYLRLRISIP